MIEDILDDVHLTGESFDVAKMVNQGRFLRLGYLTTRIEPYSSLIARGMSRLVTALGLKGTAVSFKPGDLFIVFARKSSSGVSYPCCHPR